MRERRERAVQATLWSDVGERSAVLRDLLHVLFRHAAIPLTVVESAEDLLAHAARSQRRTDDHVLIIDCCSGLSSDIPRCSAIVTRTTLPVHIIHPHAKSVRDLEEVAGRPLVWLPAAFAWPRLLDKLETLKVLVALQREPGQRVTLTTREREVLALVAAGVRNDAIAQHLHISLATVKTHLRHLKHKLGVRTRKELRHFRHPDASAFSPDRRTPSARTLISRPSAVADDDS